MSKKIKELLLMYVITLAVAYGLAVALSCIACGLADNPGRWEYHFLTTFWFIPEIFILFNIFIFAAIALTELIFFVGKKVAA